ncbi:uncharacterized protein [Mytilus edulis]|uniref:uncharacterized protein n=1 Tax=Mytilus edulis TaxID=6550 RepID=UPI0039F07AFD
MNSSSPLPNNTIFVSMDVCSLYTNIPKDEGIAACEKVWNTRKDKHPQTDCLVQLLKLVLENNNFIFNDKHFIQIDGTSMGTKMAPSFANIFMGDLEERILLSVPYKPLSWLRFIDDIDMKWNDTAEHLQDFLDHCNQFHQSIKFTSEFSSEKIAFLDTTTFVKNGVMTTDLHTKKTDKHQFLSPKSCHPKHCSRSIPYSQAIRLKRICSSESKLNYRLGQLKTQLKSRGYKTQNITDAFDKAKEKDRASLMEYKDKTTRADRIPFVVTFHPDLTNISSSIRKHWRLIENDSSLKEIFPSPPVIAYRRPKNLKDILVTSKVKKHETSKFGCYKQCGRRNCKCCKAANTDHSFSSTVTKQRYNIYVTSNCKTENSIYILTCGTCKLQFVGETETTFNIRLNNHRSFIQKEETVQLRDTS